MDIKINKKEGVSIWTNFFFLIPLIIALEQNRLLFATLVLLVMLSSGAYHTIKKPGSDWWWKVRGRTPLQTTMLYSDTIFASLLFIYNLSLFQSAGFNGKFWLAVLFAIPALVLYWDSGKKYVAHHGMWHVLAAFITVLALLT